MRFYRYEDVAYTDGIHIHEIVFHLVKETPKGYWIRRGSRDGPYLFLGNHKRWVSKTSRKRLAFPTKEEALRSFRARKNRQIVILETRLQRAKSALFKADLKEME